MFIRFETLKLVYPLSKWHWSAELSSLYHTWLISSLFFKTFNVQCNLARTFKARNDARLRNSRFLFLQTQFGILNFNVAISLNLDSEKENDSRARGSQLRRLPDGKVKTMCNWQLLDNIITYSLWIYGCFGIGAHTVPAWEQSIGLNWWDLEDHVVSSPFLPSSSSRHLQMPEKHISSDYPAHSVACPQHYSVSHLLTTLFDRFQLIWRWCTSN